MRPGLCERCAHRGPWRGLFGHPLEEADCRARGVVVDSWTMPEQCDRYEAVSRADAEENETPRPGQGSGEA